MNRMPVLFVGHGSPMNAIEDNSFTHEWVRIAAGIPRPEIILSVSAHWTANGTKITDSDRPRTVYDMYGFPKELYEVKYQPFGSPETAHMVQELLAGSQIDNSWGIDHGTWSVLHRMYPEADIPVFQVSLDLNGTRRYHFEMGRALTSLREKGVLIFGSGNVVHNLSRVNWGMTSGGYDWAVEFDSYIKDKIVKREFDDVIDYKKAGQSALSAFHTTEHFDPLLCVLGASDEKDTLTVFNDSCTMGSLSMTGYLFE